MKIQLDLDNKTIKLEENTSIKFEKLIDDLERILPNKEWMKFSLETVQLYNWNYPIIIDKLSPSHYPWITYTEGPLINIPSTTSYEIKSGVYNIQM